jgi:hypothetical protein
VSLHEWLSNAGYYLDNRGIAGGLELASGELVAGVCSRLDPYLPASGTNVYERDWDLLVVLDTCRVDALRAVADEYEYFPAEVPSTWSVGSKTREWMRKTFTREYADEVARTAFVTFNPNSEDELDPADFLHLQEVWRTDWVAEQGGVPPEPITDHAIAAGRELDPDRLIAHYKQPHAPYARLDGFDATNPFDATENDRSGVFGAIIEGDLSRERAWTGYLNELRWALDDVERLLANVDADRVAITADHGECFGEWGLYGHHEAVPVRVLREVPWVETTATDTGESEPDVSVAGGSDRSVAGRPVEEKLAALGYR